MNALFSAAAAAAATAVAPVSVWTRWSEEAAPLLRHGDQEDCAQALSKLSAKLGQRVLGSSTGIWPSKLCVQWRWWQDPPGRCSVETDFPVCTAEICEAVVFFILACRHLRQRGDGALLEAVWLVASDFGPLPPPQLEQLCPPPPLPPEPGALLAIRHEPLPLQHGRIPVTQLLNALASGDETITAAAVQAAVLATIQ